MPTNPSLVCVQRLTAAALRLEEDVDPGPLPGSEGARSFDGVQAADLVRAALRHRVTDVLHAQTEALGMAGHFGDGLVQWLAQDHAATARGVAVQLLELSRVLGAFEEAGIEVLSLKGPALAMQSAGSSAARGYGDLDLFVAPASVEAARAVLLDQGWAPRTFGSAPPGTWAWRHLLRTFNEIAFDGRASSVDLHWRLDPTPGALPDFADAWSRRDLVEVGGLLGDPITVPTLSPRDAFVHSCWHAAKDEWKWLRSLVDVHRLARQPAVWADWPDTRGGFATRPVRNTLAVTDHLLGLPAAVPDDLRGPGRTGRVIRRAESRQLHEPRAAHPLPGGPERARPPPPPGRRTPAERRRTGVVGGRDPRPVRGRHRGPGRLDRGTQARAEAGRLAAVPVRPLGLATSAYAGKGGVDGGSASSVPSKEALT